MANEKAAISISPTDIKIDEVGRVIISDPVLAESLIRIRNLNVGGELSCNVGDCGDVNTGNCGGGGTINASCGRLDNIEISDIYSRLIVGSDIKPLDDIEAIREHITRPGGIDSEHIIRPLDDIEAIREHIIRPLDDIEAIREHITRDGPAGDRP